MTTHFKQLKSFKEIQIFSPNPEKETISWASCPREAESCYSLVAYGAGENLGYI